MNGNEQGRGNSAHGSPIESRQWHETRDATTALREVLTALGMQREFPYLRADLNAFGEGFVELGRISPQTATRLAALLNLALTRPHDPENTRSTAHRGATE